VADRDENVADEMVAADLVLGNAEPVSNINEFSRFKHVGVRQIRRRLGDTPVDAVRAPVFLPASNPIGTIGGTQSHL
jgi:hypothetical protein